VEIGLGGSSPELVADAVAHQGHALHVEIGSGDSNSEQVADAVAQQQQQLLVDIAEKATSMALPKSVVFQANAKPLHTFREIGVQTMPFNDDRQEMHVSREFRDIGVQTSPSPWLRLPSEAPPLPLSCPTSATPPPLSQNANSDHQNQRKMTLEGGKQILLKRWAMQELFLPDMQRVVAQHLQQQVSCVAQRTFQEMLSPPLQTPTFNMPPLISFGTTISNSFSE